MTSVLVAYGSKNGATAEIADAIAKQLAAAGLEVDCRPAGEVGELGGHDAVVLGSAVYMKRWRREARRLLSRQARALSKRPFWVFSSGPCGKDADLSKTDWSEPAKTIAKAERLGVRDHVVFGGRLPIEPGNFIERAMVKNSPEELLDLRDWVSIRAWADGIASALAPAAAASG